MDTLETSSGLAGWLSQIAEYAPDLFEENGTPSPEALRIAESCETFRNADAASNWADIITTGARITANAFTREREHGSVNATRASVDSLSRDYDRTPRAVAGHVDPMEGARHRSVTRRSRRGRTIAEVKGYGVAPVQGSTDAPDPDDVRAAMASHLLGYVRHLALGLNALNVLQITDAVYGNELPTEVVGLRADGSERRTVLVGTEFEAKSQVFDPFHPACFEPIAEHNRVTIDPLPRQGVRYETPSETGPLYGPRRPVMVWTAHATSSHTDGTTRGATFRDRPLPRVKARKSEAFKLEPRKTLCIWRQDGRTVDLSTTRIPLLAPSDHAHVIDDEEGTAWFGHQLKLRGARQRRQASRDRARAARRAIVARTLPSVTIESLAGWSELVDSLAPGDGVKIRANGTFVLSLSRSPIAGKFNLRLMADAPVGKSGRVALNLQIRSAATVARRLHAAVI